MKMNKLSRSLNLLSIACLSLFGLFVIILGWINPSLGESGLLLFVLLYCCGLIPLGFFSAVRLLWVGRKKMSRTSFWIIFQVIFLVSFAIYTSPFVGLFFSSLLILMFPLLGFVDFLYAFQNGFSLRFIGLGSIGVVWSILLMWRFKGNLIDEYIVTLITGSNNLWLLNALMYGFAWMIIAGVVSFGFELLGALSREFHSK